jgi:lactoylglutathione lyase
MYKAGKITANLMVNNVNSTINYYQDILGFNLIMTVPDSGQFNWALLQKDTVLIMLHLKESFLEEYPNSQATAGGSFVLYFDIEGIVELY